MKKARTYKAKGLMQLFTRAIYCEVPKYLPLENEEFPLLTIEGDLDGWAISANDPSKVLDVFDKIYLKEGYILDAYQYTASNNGNAVVYGFKSGDTIPDPDECPINENYALKPPTPENAINDIMSLIEGDGSYRSYISASLFARAISEFGAMWHGSYWSDHIIIDLNPFKKEENQIISKSNDILLTAHDAWDIKEELPDEWTPMVEIDSNSVTVTFITVSQEGSISIVLHKDVYTDNGYEFTSTQVVLATGDIFMIH